MRLTKPELAVVGLVMVIGVSLLIPFVLHQRSSARKLTCQDRLRRAAQAIQEFDLQHQALPGYRQGEGEGTSWVVAMLPFLTAAGDGDTTHFNTAHAAALERKEANLRLPELLCPATADYTHRAPLALVANCGMPDAASPDALPPDWQANGLFFDQGENVQAVSTSLRWLGEHDGTKVTILLSENVDAISWLEPTEASLGIVWAANFADGQPTPLPTVWPINEQTGQGDGTIKFARPSSHHLGGVNLVMADGETQFFSQAVDYLVYQRLLTADGASVKVPGKEKLLSEPWRHE